MEDYLADPAISSSGLKHIARSGAHYQYFRKNPKPSTRDQELGTVLHVAMFEPDQLNSRRYIRPSTYQSTPTTSKPWHSSSNVCKEWLASHADKPVVTEEESKLIEAMRAAVMRHPAARAALTASGAMAEQSAFCVDTITGLRMKARFDFMAGNALVDLKKCRDSSKTFTKTIANFGYDLQAAFHLEVAQNLDLGKEHFIFIAVEDEPPHGVGVYELTSKSLGAAQSKMRRLMYRYADCVKSNEWPAYSPHVEYLDLPAYALSAEFNASLLEDQLPALQIENV